MDINNMEIEEKYYRGCITIDLDAIYENIENLKKNLKVGTKITAVVKSDGYGHGAIPIVKAVDELVDAYAVATIDEAINLRENGVDKPIYVIGFTHKSQIKRAILGDVRITVFDYETALAAEEEAEKLNKNALIHIKVDTGMSRIGFKDNDESIEIIKKINALNNVVIEGIFTHFATADETDKKKTFNQFNRFVSFTDKLKENGVNIPIRHCANSAAMMEIQEADLDNVRAGIAMYGLYPSEEVDKNSVKLKPALGLISHIIFIKDIEKGTEVSYGGTFVADRKMRIATIPLGYGDGYRRSLSNKGYVLINGKKARILGRICMDQFMVDVSDIDANEGDTVILIGRSGDEELSVEKMAEMAGDTFNYEIVCDLGKRIPRVFFRKGKIVCTKDYFNDRYSVDI